MCLYFWLLALSIDFRTCSSKNLVTLDCILLLFFIANLARWQLSSYTRSLRHHSCSGSWFNHSIMTPYTCEVDSLPKSSSQKGTIPHGYAPRKMPTFHLKEKENFLVRWQKNVVQKGIAKCGITFLYMVVSSEFYWIAYQYCQAQQKLKPKPRLSWVGSIFYPTTHPISNPGCTF